MRVNFCNFYTVHIFLQNQANSIVEDMFPTNEDTPNEPDSSLDRLVVSMSADLIDDFPGTKIFEKFREIRNFVKT